MTKNFDKLYHLFLEATSFTTLPDDLPYGFWISPSGDFFVVPVQRHYEIAEEIIQNSAILSKEIDPDGELIEELQRRKYIRVARMVGREYAADIFIMRREPIKLSHLNRQILP